MLLQQSVVDVMPWISLVAREVDRAIDGDRQFDVDLNDAGVTALVPVVGAPRLALHVLDGELLLRRQREVLQRPSAAAVDGRTKDGIDLVGRNHELVSEGRIPFEQRSWSRQQPSKLLE